MTEEIQEYIDKMAKLANTCTNEKDPDSLFREIHSLKAITYYHKYDEISILLEKTETILYFIKNYDCGIDCIFPWLNELSVQVKKWILQIRHGKTPEFFSEFFDIMPSVKCKHHRTTKIIENVQIVLIFREEAVSNLMYDVLKTKFKYITKVEDINSVMDIVKSSDSFIISSLKYANSNVVSLVQQLNLIDFNLNNLYIASNFEVTSDVVKIKDKLGVPNIFNLKHQKLSDIKDSILSKLGDDHNLVKIPDNKITLVELSKLIKPLKTTMIELSKICFDDSDPKEVAKAIHRDPMFSAILLRTMNTPYMGLPNKISNVNVAVQLLGKSRVGAIVLAEMSKDLFSEPDLDAYGISVENLIDSSSTRTQFVQAWLKYIDMEPAKKEEVVTLVNLLPVGQILTNQAVIHNGEAKRFRQFIDFQDVYNHEKISLGYNSLDALGRLFEIWNLPKNFNVILKAIKEHGVQKNRQLSTVATIVVTSFELFRLDGTFSIDTDAIRKVERIGLKGNDMKNIFMQITNGKMHGNLF